jgi:cobalt-zinc-cadmium efflux system outer membrane protein
MQFVIRSAVRLLVIAAFCAAVCLPQNTPARKAYTWQELRTKFEALNPTLRAGQIGIDEARAQETTAYLRPNPDFTLLVDQVDPFPDPITSYPYRPFQYALPEVSTSYLHERHHKRELRRESARQGTSIAESGQADLERNLLFNLRNAFVQTLQAKAVLQVARENLSYWDRVLDASRARLQAGDNSQIDLDRLELQRVQFASDVQTATVNLRTAKITLLALLNDRMPVDQFDVTGTFDFTDGLPSLDELRKLALDTRPDLKAAAQAIDKARTDHRLAVANGSTDPTFGFDFARNPPIPLYVGFNVNIPIRIFDRNQGEKLRTELDISRSEKLREAAASQVLGDVDSAYATIAGSLALLRPYKAQYLQQAARVRDNISFAYQHGGSSLLDFLNAQNDYRSIRLTYLNLVGAYLTAASQLDLAVGREVIP